MFDGVTNERRVLGIKPKPRFCDGYSIIEEGFYKTGSIFRIIRGSGVAGSKFYGMELMRGCKRSMKYRYAWTGSDSWGGYAVAVTRRYLRRYYSKTVFFDNEIMEIIRPLIDRFNITHSTINAYCDSFRMYHDDYRVIFKGNTIYLEKDRYNMCKSIFKQVNKSTQLEADYAGIN